ncbi:hypothetical protein ZWY2020_021231 [Hordeum vulgare]|nr:hypothetical protein ZWY2020_021231 [Hordeum vulgare]
MVAWQSRLIRTSSTAVVSSSSSLNSARSPDRTVGDNSYWKRRVISSRASLVTSVSSWTISRLLQTSFSASLVTSTITRRSLASEVVRRSENPRSIVTPARVFLRFAMLLDGVRGGPDKSDASGCTKSWARLPTA